MSGKDTPPAASKSVSFASEDNLLDIRHVEARSEMSKDKLAALFISREELNRYSVQQRSLVRKARRRYHGDMSHLPCGGRGLEEFQSPEHAEQIKMSHSHVIRGVLEEQQRRRGLQLPETERHTVVDDDADYDDTVEDIRRASELHSRWSREKARDLGIKDEMALVAEESDGSRRLSVVRRVRMAAKMLLALSHVTQRMGKPTTVAQ